MTDTTPGPTGSHSPSGLYAFAQCEAVDMQNGGVLLLDRDSDAQLLVAQPVAQSMLSCRVFRTLEEHAEVLTANFAQLAGQRDDVMKVLGMLRDAGLMTSAEAVCARLNARVPPPLDLPPTRVFVITCDRPAAVERLLESMLRWGNLSRHEAIYLVDDSRDADNAQRNRDAVEKFNLTCPRSMHYVGAAQARRLMELMIAAQPEQEAAIRFLIDRDHWRAAPTYGLARNLCLLLSVNRRAIIMDDDVICVAVDSPHKQPGLLFGQTEREADIYRDLREMYARTTQAEFDPLTGHASCLGFNMGQAIARVLGRPLEPGDLAGAKSAPLSMWGAQSPLLVTQSGTLGDPGTPGTEWLYELEGESLRRMLNFPDGVAGALTSRCYWLGYPAPCFTKMAVMSQVTGLDNSRLLPPYLPAYRGEDYLFGAMTEYLHPESAVLNYAWSVPHAPLEQRAAQPNPEPSSGRGKFNPGKIVTDRTVYQAGIPAESRLQSLAAFAGELAQADDRGLKLLFRREVAELQALDLARLGGLLQDGTLRPPQWQDWLQRTFQALQNASATPAALTDVRGLDPTLRETEILARFRAIASGFSAALANWPIIREAAGTITADGGIPEASAT